MWKTHDVRINEKGREMDVIYDKCDKIEEKDKVNNCVFVECSHCVSVLV